MYEGIGYRLSGPEIYALEQSNPFMAQGYALGFVDFSCREFYLGELPQTWRDWVLQNQPQPHRAQPEIAPKTMEPVMKMTLTPHNPQVAKLWKNAQVVIQQMEMIHDDINRDENPTDIACRVMQRLQDLADSGALEDMSRQLESMITPPA